MSTRQMSKHWLLSLPFIMTTLFLFFPLLAEAVEPARGMKTGAYTGIFAKIETANPQVRANQSFSVGHIGVRSGDFFGEMGWYKGWRSNNQLRVYVARQNSHAYNIVLWNLGLNVGTKHRYRMFWNNNCV